MACSTYQDEHQPFVSRVYLGHFPLVTFLCLTSIITSLPSCQVLIYTMSHNLCTPFVVDSLQWRHNGRDSISNHQPRDCILNRLFRRRSKKTSKLRVTGLCAGNSPGTGEFHAQMASYAENVSIWWHHVSCNHISSTARLINPSQLFTIFWQVWKSFPWRWSKIKEYSGVMNMYEPHWNYLKPLNAIFLRKCNSFWIFHHSSMLKYLCQKLKNIFTGWTYTLLLSFLSFQMFTGGGPLFQSKLHLLCIVLLSGF